MVRAMHFRWQPNTPPPSIEEHSKAKLDVFRRYLRAYFNRLNINPSRDHFRLDLVDGFSGGGIFQDGNQTMPGTPLIMLEETHNARKRLNQGRTKPLNFDCKYYFVDVNRDHTDHLRMVLAGYGYQPDGGDIAVYDSRFQDVADKIIESIRRRQPRAGRAIFLLDQTGFSQVELNLVARILSSLPAAEVILTFATDALINHLAERPEITKAVAPLEVTTGQIRDLIEMRNRDGGKALVQRVLRGHIRSITNATFDTPFFIRPTHSRRALWFLHLSRHPTARDVMIQCHWASSNTFEHFGSGDFNMLGWDALNSGSIPLFNFRELDAQQMRTQLLESMPAELYALTSEQPITIDAMHYMFANRTAASFADLDRIVLELASGREIDILDAEGKIRSRRISQLRPTDQIAFPAQPLLPGLDLRKRS